MLLALFAIVQGFQCPRAVSPTRGKRMAAPRADALELAGGATVLTAGVAWFYASKVSGDKQDSLQGDLSVDTSSPSYIASRSTWREEELAQFDGNAGNGDGPILLAADGVVFNVAAGRRFYGPGGAYAAFSGRDASRLLGKGIESPEEDTAPELPLNLAEKAALQAWVFSFKRKYAVVGRLETPAEVEAARARQEAELERGSLLLRAAAESDVDVALAGVQSALSKGADVDFADAGGAALHRVAAVGHAAVINVLLSGGASTELRGSKGRTALHLACEAGHAASVDALLAAGAAADSEANDGWTPLHLAAQKGHADCVRSLLVRDVPLDCASAVGVTPLIAAATYGHVEAVRLLVEAGADRAITCRAKTAAEWAEDRGQEEVITLLRDPDQ
jgi:predicted heme/steroid binding protein